MDLVVLKTKREENIRYIRSKIICADDSQLGLIAAFVRGLDIMGWSEDEFNRDVDAKEGAK